MSRPLARLRLLRILGIRWLRIHPLRAAITIVTIAAGTSLALSVVVSMTSLSWSFTNFGRAVSTRATLRVIGATTRGGLSENLLPAVSATRGVAVAVPIVEAVTNLTVAGGGRRQRETTVIALGVEPNEMSLFSSGSALAGLPGSGSVSGSARPVGGIVPTCPAGPGSGGASAPALYVSRNIAALRARTPGTVMLGTESGQ